MLIELIRLLRPAQWIKNGFVFIGVLFAHAWAEPAQVWLASKAFLAFCLLSSCVYVMNDILDQEQDRQHPTKRKRPLASGALGMRAAIVSMLVLGAAGFTLALKGGGSHPWIFFAYLCVNIAYSLGVKHIVILDVFFIASGFMLRILAGTLGIGIAPSQWLLLCGLLLTLFLGFAKRRAEMNLLAAQGGSHRRVLEHYSEPLLDQMITVAASGTLVAYSLYTVSAETVSLHGTTDLIYTVPFVLYGMLRYLYLLHRRGGGGDPAVEMVRDAHLVAAALGWLGTTALILMPAG